MTTISRLRSNLLAVSAFSLLCADRQSLSVPEVPDRFESDSVVESVESFV